MVLAVPADYWGTVTVNGELATDGTIVSAFIDGQLQDVYTVGDILVDNQYLVHVQGEEGDLVTFQINGHDADQTADWISGGYELDLTVAYDEGDNGDDGGNSPGGGNRGSSRKRQCDDGEDNDRDGLIDLHDPGCEDKYDDDETDIVEETTTSTEEENTKTLTENFDTAEEETQSNWFTNLITGAAVGGGENAAWTTAILVLIIVALFLVYAVFFKKKKPVTKPFETKK